MDKIEISKDDMSSLLTLAATMGICEGSGIGRVSSNDIGWELVGKGRKWADKLMDIHYPKDKSE